MKKTKLKIFFETRYENYLDLFKKRIDSVRYYGILQELVFIQVSAGFINGTEYQNRMNEIDKIFSGVFNE